MNQEKPSNIKAFPLAQPVEHLTFNQRARGSSPRRVTKKAGHSVRSVLLFWRLFGADENPN